MGKLYLIPCKHDIEASLEIAQKYDAHFEYNDFYNPDTLDDENAVSELISFYKSLPRDRSHDSLHGVFLDIAIHSSDRLIRQVSDQRIRKSMDIASELGIESVIFHTNLIPHFKNSSYVSGWVEKNAEYWRNLAMEYPALNIYIENMFDDEPDALIRLMEKVSDVANVKACLDYAHANVFGHRSAQWLALLPYVAHIHINDNDGISDSHMPLGAGIIDYKPLDHAIRYAHATPTVLIETSRPQDQLQSIEYLKKNGIYPFEKGGTANA